MKFKNQTRTTQGMATLWAATLLMLLTSLMGWLSFQSIAAETTRSQQHMFASQALNASEALLETVIAYLDWQYAHSDASVDTLLWASASSLQCLAPQKIQQQCLQWRFNSLPLSSLSLPQDLHPELSVVSISRDVLQAPNKINITVQIVLGHSHAGAGSRATVQQSLYLPISVPITEPITEPIIAPTTLPAAPCLAQTWSQVFGSLQIDQYKAIAASQVQTGLNAQSVPAQTVYWIDSPLHWTQSLGSPAAPVALVFSEVACALQCPQISDSVSIEGLVYFQSPCQPHLAQVIPNGLALNFKGPTGVAASRVHRERGSWKHGSAP
jgi:hypothetical protein